MIEKFNGYWQELTSDNKLLIKQIGVASIVLYVAFQILGYLTPFAITGYACYWVYKNVLIENPRVMK